MSLVLQAMSARSNAPECHIGQAHRFRQKQDVEFGTSLFQHKGSLGLQGISTKPSLPSYSLGASTRDQMYKVQLHWGLESVGEGADNLGGGRGGGGGGQSSLWGNVGPSWQKEEGWKVLSGFERMQNVSLVRLIIVQQTDLCKLLCITLCSWQSSTGAL